MVNIISWTARYEFKLEQRGIGLKLIQKDCSTQWSKQILFADVRGK